MADKPTDSNQYFVDEDGGLWRSRGSGVQVGEIRLTNETVARHKRKMFGHKLDELDWSKVAEIDLDEYTFLQAIGNDNGFDSDFMKKQAYEIYQKRK